MYVFCALVVSLVVALVLSVAPQGPREVTILPAAGIVAFDPGEVRPGDTISCPGHGSAVVPEAGGVVIHAGGVSLSVEPDGGVFASCSSTDV